MLYHLDYLKLGYWMISVSDGPLEYGGTFYRASPAYSITIDFDDARDSGHRDI